MGKSKIEWTDASIYCACGCGKMVSPIGSQGRKRKFIAGHNLLLPEAKEASRRNRSPRKGQRNPNWKGGKTITEHGYILLRMPGHHLADIRGYVYEHRLVAEEKIGRKLSPGEIVHHIDSNKQNNSPENIEVVMGNAEHYLNHRKNKNLRKPGEENPFVSCACGCNGEFRKYDNGGRPRKYISGHNSRAVISHGR